MMEEPEREVPAVLACPVCRDLLKNAVELPCCRSSVCRSCAMKKLVMLKKKCWIVSTPMCSSGTIQLDQLSPSTDKRQLVEDWKQGGNLYMENEQQQSDVNGEDVEVAPVPPVPPDIEPPDIIPPNREPPDKNPSDKDSPKIVELPDLEPLKLEPLDIEIKQEPMEEEQEEESRIKGNPELSAKIAEAKARLDRNNSESHKSSEETKEGTETKTSPNNEEVKESQTENEGNILETEHSASEEIEKESNRITPPHQEEVMEEQCSETALTPLTPVSQEEEEEEEEYNETLPITQDDDEYGEGVNDANEYSENSGGPQVKQEILIKQETTTTEETMFDNSREFKREPGLCTPTSSGYWSDEGMGNGPYFGKLSWNPSTPGKGVVHLVTEGREERKVPVTSYDVKCGAETGDLVEFSLGTSTDSQGQVVKTATRVKLVEKGIPKCEQEQIRGQEGLKRSLAELRETGANKRMKTDEVIDLNIANFGDYSDIADIVEEGDDDTDEEEEDEKQAETLYPYCICSKRILSRCQQCPFYFIEADATHSIMPGETLTLLAKITGNLGDMKRDLVKVRQLPFPFKFLAQSSFDLIRKIKRESLIAKVMEVYSDDRAFATLKNLGKERILVRPGDVLGICQAELGDFEVEEPLKGVGVIATDRGLVRDERGAFCGFARLEGDANYQYCLVRLELKSELTRRFRLVKSEVTVQTRTSLFVELEAKNGTSNLAKYMPKDGRIATASSIMNDEAVRKVLGRNREESLSWMKELKSDVSVNDERQGTKLHGSNHSSSSVSRVSSHQSARDALNAYDEMLKQIDQDMKTNTAHKDGQLDEHMMDRVYRGVVASELTIPQGSSVVTNLFLVDDEIPDLRCLVKFRARVTNNEEFKYYNNCYNIAEQTVTITNGICRLTRTTRPCVKVHITNPRVGTACFKRDSPIALVKIHIEEVVPPPATTIKTPPPSISKSNQSVKSKDSSPNKRQFLATKHLEKVQRKLNRRWDQLVGQGVWEKSLTVEERYPFFSRNPLRTPFGLKDKELNMRVGTSQSVKPVKVLDKVNGVFTCFICDVVVLDKYNCQDHWYSAQHRATMAQVQVIAGPEERLAMGRPVVMELLNQWTMCPLLGMDRVVEVLQGRKSPYYHCSICGVDSSLSELVTHIASPEHILPFLEQYFPVAWERFAPSPDPTLWNEQDFTVLDQVVARIDSVHGKKRPSIVESTEKLPSVLAKLPVTSYVSKALDSFFLTLPIANVPKSKPSKVVKFDFGGKLRILEATVVEAVLIPPGARMEVVMKVVGAAAYTASSMAGKWVNVSQGREVTQLVVQRGLSRLWLDDSDRLCVIVSLVNPGVGASVSAREHNHIASVCWME